MIQDILRGSKEFKRILKDIKSGNNAHSYLFSSQDKFTARQMARLVANALLCSDLCGKCENCLKFQNEHPDVKYFPKKNQLLVEDSNYIVEESFVKPIFADKKIFVIDDFDNSTPASQNKLLKVLEEPNGNMFYLLSTSSLENVLPTIRSRCFKVEIGAFGKDEIKAAFLQSNQKFDELAFSLGGGYLGKTIELSKKEDLQQIFELALNVICSLKSSKEVLVYSKKMQDKKEDILLIFEIISKLLEDVVSLKLRKYENLVVPMARERLEKILNDYSLRAVVEIEKLLVGVVKKLKAMVNPSLVVDNFLMGMLEVKYLCK